MIYLYTDDKKAQITDSMLATLAAATRTTGQIIMTNSATLHTQIRKAHIPYERHTCDVISTSSKRMTAIFEQIISEYGIDTIIVLQTKHRANAHIMALRAINRINVISL